MVNKGDNNNNNNVRISKLASVGFMELIHSPAGQYSP